MKKFLTPARLEALEKSLNNYASYAASTTRKVKTPNQFREEATSSWNSFQKAIKQLNKYNKITYKPSAKQLSKVNKLVSQINKRIDTEKLNMTYIKPDDIIKSSPTWNAFQRNMKTYRGLLRKNATRIVGYTPAGQPLYKWESDIVNSKLPILNQRRKELLEKLNFSWKAGTLGSEEYWALQPKQNPLNSKMEKWRLDPTIKSIITQADPDYLNYKQKLYKANFLKSALKVPNETLQELLWNLIQQTKPDKLYQIQAGESLMSMEFIYDEYAVKDLTGEVFTMDERAVIVYNKLLEGLGENGFKIE